jgi:hypothetical protein
MMKKFFVKTALFCGLLCAGIGALIFLLPLPENYYALAIIDKQRMLAAAESPKLVLAGGSNLAFGLDSAAMHARFQFPVVNMGFHAGFGLGRILDGISPSLRQGDILLIIPEYEHFSEQWSGIADAYALIFDARQYQFAFSPYYGLPSGFSTYLVTHVQAFFARFRPPNPHAYSRDGFNEYGDYIKHLNLENRPFAPSKPLVFLDKAALRHFFQFVDMFARRGIHVLLSYPSYEERAYAANRDLINELDALFRAKENLRVISSPGSYCFPRELFYDTRYHLNGEGRALRTERLIRDLGEYFPEPYTK